MREKGFYKVHEKDVLFTPEYHIRDLTRVQHDINS